ncbi:UNVERIFIED_CONTAM: hypothetical protein NCL1_08206 [Trichonephila clavipes]
MPRNHTTWTLWIFCVMKIHRLGSGSNPQPWRQKASDKPTTPPNRDLEISGRGSRVIKASDRGWPYHEFEPSTPKTRRVGQRCT